MTRPVVFAATLCAAVGQLSIAAAQVKPGETDPNKIMIAVDDRDTGDKMVATVQLVIDERGRRRSLTFRNSVLEFKAGTKRLLQFIAPNDVRNTGLLSVEYDSASKADQQWIYLPRLRKSKRLADADRSNSWMGSDFSYSDLARHAPDEYDHRLVKANVRVDGEPCWVIESRPKTRRAKDETGYVKIHWWVSKQKLLTLQAKSWVRKGRKIKLFKFDKLKKVDGVWVAHQIAARTLSGGKLVSTSVMRMSDVKIKKARLESARFTVSGLERGI